MYLVVNFQKLGDVNTAQSVFPYATSAKARSAYHQTIASNYVSLEDTNNALSGFLVCLIDSRGMSVLQESVNID